MDGLAAEPCIGDGSERRQAVLDRFRTTLRAPDGFLVGAATGAGALAQAAEVGGADFVLALNAGRLRVMGAPSVASMLPIRDSNRFVAEFACTEVLTQTRLPVFFGAAVTDPGFGPAMFASCVRDWGFAGITNFPTSIHLPVSVAAALDRAGIGFRQELALLSAARAAGLVALAYVATVDQARRAAQAGVDIVCLNFGWNVGGRKGMRTGRSMEEVALLAHEAARAVRRVQPDGLCLIEGGPIEKAEQLADLCQGSGLQGYIGGSTLDRLPLEDSIADRTSAFKAVRSLHRQTLRDSDRRRAFGRRVGFVGDSPALSALLSELPRLAGLPGLLLVTGEAGSGHDRALRALHHLAAASGREWRRDHVTLSCRDLTERQIAVELFGLDASEEDRTRRYGLLETPSVGTVMLRHADRLPKRLQWRLLRLAEQGAFTPVRSRRRVACDVRVILASERPWADAVADGSVTDELRQALLGREVVLTPLRHRPEDIPVAVALALAALRRRTASGDDASQGDPIRFAPGAVQRLMAHDWPGNLDEVDRVAVRIDAALREDGDSVVEARTVDGLLRTELAPLSPRLTSDRDIVLDALWRHRFHRQRTADYLGISRKTLFNRIKRYGLSPAAG